MVKLGIAYYGMLYDVVLLIDIVVLLFDIAAKCNYYRIFFSSKGTFLVFEVSTT
jgi:hypothetical protein